MRTPPPPPPPPHSDPLVRPVHFAMYAANKIRDDFSCFFFMTIFLSNDIIAAISRKIVRMVEIKQMPLWIIVHIPRSNHTQIRSNYEGKICLTISNFNSDLFFFFCYCCCLFVCPKQDNSKKEWEFRKAVTILSYCNCHPIPVPLNIISTLVLAIPGLIKKKEQKKDDVDAKSVLVRC